MLGFFGSSVPQLRLVYVVMVKSLPFIHSDCGRIQNIQLYIPISMCMSIIFEAHILRDGVCVVNLWR